MDVDTPNLLKRCSSAPLINNASSTAASSSITNTTPRSTALFSMSINSQPRTRRSSYHFGPLVTPVNLNNTWGSLSLRRTPRVNQLRDEECANVSNTREVAHEREVHSAIQMGQSCEDLTLVAGLANSPTRNPRFSPVVSPSPTRKYTTRRSVSPITLRPATLSPINRQTSLVGKRRCDEVDPPVVKRICTMDRLTPSTPGTPDSDSLDCTFRPVSPRPQPMNESTQESQDMQENHKPAVLS